MRDVARRRRAARRRRRATTVISFLTVLFVVAAIVLAVAGWKATLRITGGTDKTITDPAAPGYTAEARASEVQLLAFTDTGGSLATSLLLVSGSGDSGPVVAPMSAKLILWDFEDAEPRSAKELFDEAGLDLLTLRTGVDLTFGIVSSAEMPFDRLTPLFEKMGPITTELPDAVYEWDDDGTQSIKYPAGELTLQPNQVGEFLAYAGRYEPELNRSLRIKPVWERVLAAYMKAPDLVDNPDDVGQNVDLWADLADAKGLPSLQILPTINIPLNIAPPGSVDRLDGGQMKGWVSTFVPFPISAYPGQRTTVNLLNGTSDPAVLRRASPLIVSAGGSIGLTGNASSFTFSQTEVSYVNAGAERSANEIAGALGTSAKRVELLPSGIDVQVVVGKDQS